ncbi:hypothetical protein JG687_00015071 [Phytophthora cactorum]|uniref:Uncharacterized protein n=1 Tax=Phytophthora cactorum TaxID=29920 RepID=A0A8T1TUR6_9STRA|nr:hypothetical protein JG687_00015071 [Phytophthora cactorum]
MRGQLQHQQQSKRNQKPMKVVVPAAEKKTLAPPRDGCLKCRGAHWLDECRRATAEQRTEVLARLREVKNSRTGSVRLKTVSAPVRANMVRIIGVADTPYILDNGADQLNVNLDVKELATPLSVYLADGRRADCADQVTVALLLGTAAGPVHMRDVQCL